jgi:hypothetical protein
MSLIQSITDICFKEGEVTKPMVDRLEQLFKDKMFEMIGDVEQRETYDMSLNSWTPEDYKVFGKNELKIELLQKVEKL